ncbi:amino acid ABC transporter permease [Eubacteriales bacterium mix99]|jgi:putative lysine transport system permease protein|nr:amino acid ABC transporter permease [Clostridiales bacterium]
MGQIMKIIIEYWPMYLRGAGVTLYLSILGTIFGFMIGLLAGIIRTIPVPEGGWKRILLRAANAILSVYIEIFRGTPMIVQAMVIYYGSAQAGFEMDRMAAGILIVSINTGAYMAEIIRGGIVSIDTGQFEAAQALGMNPVQTMAKVVLPQAIRNILPAIGNEFVINIKDTSVLNVISISELYFQTSTVAGIHFSFFGPFFIACILYFIMTFTVTRILRMTEKRLDGPKNYTLANEVRKGKEVQYGEGN